ncbi:glycosyltransferase, partial [Escherichia coli]
PAYGPQNDVTLKMPAFEWVHVQLHQQKGMISLSPPTICNSALSRLHVVCYVTNTECSPMIALESASVGTPCVVGPAGNIYKGFPELELYLVEKEVDNPTAIRNRLQLVRDNYAEVKVLLNAFVLEYNSRLELIKEKMYKELKQ